jgi:3-hydroxyacyl-[acyl-carrier-protein] dehydratase|tara:strand:+ start:1125 stop:1574 length:450 start_codon:yes stop_codon:yes gene_type:complete
VSEITIKEILNTLPHRYPFLLIDRVIEWEAFKSIKALKNVTINEPFFQGHFPKRPIMPGVLILEAMAQATGVLAFYSYKTRSKNDAEYYLVAVDKARFKRPVGPGDQLIIDATLTRQRSGIYRFVATAHVDGELVSSAEFMTTEMEDDP